jgi:hypothetical protein
LVRQLLYLLFADEETKVELIVQGRIFGHKTDWYSNPGCLNCFGVEKKAAEGYRVGK